MEEFKNAAAADEELRDDLSKAVFPNVDKINVDTIATDRSLNSTIKELGGDF